MTVEMSLRKPVVLPFALLAISMDNPKITIP
jgi:hypothetical protein